MTDTNHRPKRGQKKDEEVTMSAEDLDQQCWKPECDFSEWKDDNNQENDHDYFLEAQKSLKKRRSQRLSARNLMINDDLEEQQHRHTKQVTNARRQSVEVLHLLGVNEQQQQQQQADAPDEEQVVLNRSRRRLLHGVLPEEQGQRQSSDDRQQGTSAQHTNNNHHNDPHHHHGRIPWYSCPVQRQLWDDDQVLPHVNWHDLFFDLIFVAAAYNLGVMLTSAMNHDDWPRGVVYFFGIFGPLYSIWENDVIYASRYTLVDYAHRVVAIFRFLFVSFAVLSIKPIELLGDEHSAESFCLVLSLLLESLIQVGLNIELYFYGDGDRKAIQNQTYRETLSHILPASLTYLVASSIAGWNYYHVTSNAEASTGYDSNHGNSDYSSSTNSTSAYSDDHHLRFLAEEADYDAKSSYANEHVGVQWNIADVPLILCWVVYLFNLLFALYQKSTRNKKDQNIREHFVPNNIDYMIHRYGEWTMLMIGESILSLLIVETVESQEYYGIALFGCLTVIILQMLKFEMHPSHADEHALWRSLTAAIWFRILIQVLSVGLIAFGVSYKLFLKDVLHENKSDSYESDKNHRWLGGAKTPITREAETWLFCVSLALVLISLEALTLAHDGIAKTYNRFFWVNKHETPPQRYLNWSLVNIYWMKGCIILITATLATWITHPFHVTIIGFFCVTAMALIQIVAWGFVHHEENILNAIHNSLNVLALRTTNSFSDEIEANVKSSSSGRLTSTTSSQEIKNLETPLPKGWKEYLDPQSGEKYFAHKQSGKTTWERPANNNLERKETNKKKSTSPGYQEGKQLHKKLTKDDNEESQPLFSKPLPVGWRECKDEKTGKVFYLDPSGNAQWNRPTEPSKDGGIDTKLPNGWKAVRDPETGETYYYNRMTRRPSWTPPFWSGSGSASEVVGGDHKT